MSAVRRLLIIAGLAPCPGAVAETIGLAVVSLKTAGVETPYLDECPEGVAIGNDEIWWKSLTPKDRDRLTDGGAKEPSARRVTATVRGPNGEDVCWNPISVIDPPLRIVTGPQSIGFNLDGTETGAATAKTCAHEKFVSSDGTTRIDNQLRRLTGCIHGWRAAGYIEMTSDTERRNSSQGVILIQISGVDTLADSPDVTVRFFRAADVMPKDAAGDIVPFASYRIDGNPRYGATAKGRIKNNVLTTEPIDARLPFFGNRVETEFSIRDLRLELTLSETGAEGLIGGYHDLDNWWDYVRKMGYLIETAQFSCPALYTAAKSLADGYPDPATGQCTALSVAYAVDAVRAFVNESAKPIVQPHDGEPMTDPQEMPPGITIREADGGSFLTTKDGWTLYTRATPDCDQACRDNFAALPAPWNASDFGAWTATAMADRTRQWTYQGRTVFTCARDREAGDKTCLALGGRLISIVDPPPLPPSFVTYPSEVGPVLADRTGRTVYRLIGSPTDFMREICSADCMSAQWHLVTADSAQNPVAGAFTIATVDGAPRWLFRGQPVYTFEGDTGPGQIAGHRFGGAGVSAKNWFTAITLDDALTTQTTAPPRNEE